MAEFPMTEYRTLGIMGEYSNSFLCGDIYPGKSLNYHYSIVTVQVSPLSHRLILFTLSIPHSQ